MAREEIVLLGPMGWVSVPKAKEADYLDKGYRKRAEAAPPVVKRKPKPTEEAAPVVAPEPEPEAAADLYAEPTQEA